MSIKSLLKSAAKSYAHHGAPAGRRPGTYRAGAAQPGRSSKVGLAQQAMREIGKLMRKPR